MPSEEEVKELGKFLRKEQDLQGFHITQYIGESETYDISIYEAQFNDTYEIVLGNKEKGIVFIGELKSFEELKDQLKRCRLS